MEEADVAQMVEWSILKWVKKWYYTLPTCFVSAEVLNHLRRMILYLRSKAKFMDPDKKGSNNTCNTW